MTRSYTSLLVFENVFDTVSVNDAVMGGLASAVFEPRVQIVEEDCGTRLGSIQELTYDLRGRIELATGEPLTQLRIEYLLSKGQYSIALRSTDTCVSEGGLCAECYKAYYGEPEPSSVGSFVRIKPLYYGAVDQVPVSTSTTFIRLNREADEYDKLRVYSSERELVQGVDFEISEQDLIFTGFSPLSEALVVKYLAESRTPFFSWLARTYAGSLLGVNSLPSPRLPLRGTLLTSLLPVASTEYVVSTLSNSDVVPQECVEYLAVTPDILEKALFAIALRSIYETATIG